MDKRFLGVLVAIAVVMGGIFYVTSDKASAPSGPAGTLTNHVEGGGSSGVTLTEYGDFQCPACGSFYPLVKQVEEKYKDQIHFQFRNFPLFQVHQNAIAGARAAEAADMQGKYWQMYDKLFQENGLYYQAQQQGTSYPSWIDSKSPLNEFSGYAGQLGLNVTKFKEDFGSKTANDRIQADLKEGNRLKVESTPTFFIDGKKISNPTTLDAFSKVIDTAITQKTGKAPATTSTPATANP
jgi:protein-disulfide isomerase